MIIESIICAHCGTEVSNGGGIYCLGDLDDVTFLCRDCFEDATVSCSRCGDRIRNDDNAGDSSIPLCQNCMTTITTV